MTPLTRRRMLGSAAATAGAAAAGAAFGGAGTAHAAAPESPSGSHAGRPERGPLSHIEHVVILMQENRSFDHYFGMLGGVRGFGDRQALRLPGGASVFHQPDKLRPDGGAMLPFRMDTGKYNAQNAEGLPHDFATMVEAANGGAWNNWTAAKGEHTMGYFTRDDIPYQYALADAFTLCDQYFCSLAGPTDPNRLYLWSGCAGPGRDGKSGPWTDNTPVTGNPVADWTTYAERLQDAGVSWRVYHNPDGTDDEHGDYDCNGLSYFRQFPAFPKDDPRYVNAMTKFDLEAFDKHCRDGSLPTVSWLVPPFNYCEHPHAGPNYGAFWVDRALRSVFANREVWSKTVFLLMYDENDGYFDHVPGPVPEAGTPEEFDKDGNPLGLGARVPMWVISPWTRGGRVNSQVFDHTSVLQFLELVTGVREPNISQWRRTVCGDLTSCFDFDHADLRIPSLPDTARLKKKADEDRQKPAVPLPAAGGQRMPKPEGGTRSRCPLPYAPSADVTVHGTTVTCAMTNHGSVGYHFSVYANAHRTFKAVPHTVRPGRSASYTWDGAEFDGAYDFSVYGADGFVRDFSGTAGPETPSVAVRNARGHLEVTVHNPGGAALPVTLAPNDFAGSRRTRRVPPRRSVTMIWPLSRDGAYDLTVTAARGGLAHRYAGRVEQYAPTGHGHGGR